MKNIIFLLIIAAFLAVSCEDWLEEDHRTQLTIENFYESPEQFEQALTGVYDRIQEMYADDEHFIPAIMVRADELWHITGGWNESMEKFRKQSAGGAWNRGYEAIKGANVILEKIEGVSFGDESDKTQIIGETYFLRALAYFELVRYFGDLPIVTEEITGDEAYDINRSPISQVYDQIMADLNEAESRLPDDDVSSSPTTYAVKAMKADIYMMQGDMASAIPLLQDIKNSGQYRLLDDFAAIFDWRNPENDEIIFQINFKGESTGENSRWSYRHHRELAANYPDIFVIESNGGLVPTLSSWLAFDHSSQRFQASVDTLYVGNVAYPYDKKHMGFQDGFDWQNEDNWQLYRYGEILLMLAEAEAAEGNSANAIEALNMVRRRAFGFDVNAASPVDYQGDGNIMDTIYHEQHVELMYEGKRFYDLVRQGRMVEVMNNEFNTDWNQVWETDVLPNLDLDNADFQVYGLDEYMDIQVEEFMTIWPIPEGEISKNPSVIRQNPGWDQL